MAQPSVASFFHTRKRAATDDISAVKNKRLFEPTDPTTEDKGSLAESTSIQVNNGDAFTIKATTDIRPRSSRQIKRSVATKSEFKEAPKNLSKTEPNTKHQQKLVQFIKKGPLSPRKKAPIEIVQIQKLNEATPPTSKNAFSSKNNRQTLQQSMKTPAKQILKSSTSLNPDELKNLVKKELNFDEVKKKISRSDKLQQLKDSLARVRELENQRIVLENQNRREREAKSVRSPKKLNRPSVHLKQFDTIDLEILTSPIKTFKTPTKQPPPTPDKNELMSPRHTDVSKRVLFSPAKNGTPSKMVVPPAYQRFMHLVETSKAGQLPLPFKYRHLIEVFKAIDSVCAMFYNRKESITFKKLKPAAQRMLRKNINETHLAQIKYLYPDAFHFTQMKMRNFGSVSKADYYQLLISPNVSEGTSEAKQLQLDEDNVLAAAQSNAMNPNVMISRLQHFQNLLLQRSLDEHDKFLKSLNPPLSIDKKKVTRWHPDFDLEKCPNIPCAQLPQPPNVEKYSSARDILATARNLFNCATPMERVMERYEAKLNVDRGNENDKNDKFTAAQYCTKSEAMLTSDISTAVPPITDITASLLKGVPKALLDKIRAKQAAKALDAMTRRPSQDQEASKYSRLPELARHLRNVFITERKGVLALEVVVKKIQNSFRTSLTQQEIESHLKLLSKEVPAWLAFHEVRNSMYLKISKDMELIKVMQHLESVANEKSK